MKLKTIEVNGATYAEVLDGKPVYIHADNKEVPFDAVTTVAAIGRLNSEAKGHREAKEAAEGKLKLFEGIEDADAAKKALETVANLNSGQLMTAGKVEEIKAAAAKAAKDQVEAAAKQSAARIQELEALNGKITSDFHNEKIGNAFGNSKFIAEKIAVPRDMIQAMFGQRFKIEDGKLVGHDAAGNKITSVKNLDGSYADFDEAFESIVISYPNRDAILKGTGNAGSGARESNNGNGTGGKTMKRSEFDAKSPMEKATLSKEITARTLTVVD